MSQFTALEEEPSTHTVSTATGKTSHRVKGVALAILQDYLDKHPSQIPSTQVRHALAAEVQKIPGNEHFKATNVYNWFRRRIVQVPVQPSPQAAPCDSRYPTLTADALKHLEVLSRAQLEPDSDIINSWATLLKVSATDIATWLHCKRLSLNQVTHPPTPASTVTPEPSVPPTPVSPTRSFPYYNEGSHSRQATPSSVAPVLKQDPRSPVLPPISVNTETQNRIYAGQQQQQPSPVSPSFTASRLERGGSALSTSSGSGFNGGDQVRRTHTSNTHHHHSISNSPPPPPSSAGATANTNGPPRSISMSRSAIRQSTPLRQVSEPPSAPSSPGPPPGMSHVHYAIYKGIEKLRDGIPPPPSPNSKVPQSLSEYRTMFAPYERKIAQIMEAVEKEKERERELLERERGIARSP